MTRNPITAERNPITENFYPDEVTLDEFLEEMRRSIEPFAVNMRNIDYDKKKMHVEKWASLFLHWCEMYNDEDKEAYKEIE